MGALYTRRRPRVRIEALQSGGGQERGIRSGTVPTPLAVGLGAACKIAQEEMAADHERISRLSERLVNGIMSRLTHVTRNGDAKHSYPGTALPRLARRGAIAQRADAPCRRNSLRPPAQAASTCRSRTSRASRC